MKLLRNSEVFRSLILMLIVSVVAVTAVFMKDERFGWMMLVTCVILCLIHMIVQVFRYKRISDLASELDHILHDDSPLMIKQYSEGELAILNTEIYKMTVRLREQSQLLKDDKLHLADFLADVSHQIRTPLTSINLLVTLLEKPDLTFERRRELTRELDAMLKRIDWLITALLKISKLDAGVIKFSSENVPMDEFIAKASRPLQIPIELRDIDLSVNAEGCFYGDVAWTCEAIGNILKNCMEHTPEGGRITVDAHENELFTEIVISDTGCGIPKDELPHIFERFYKGKDSDEKSFGIGLALARMIVIGQNGTLKAESPAEGGARFVMRFYKVVI